MNAKGQKEQGKWIRASTEGTINGDFSFKESDVLCMCIQKVGTWPQMKKGKKNCKTMRESLLFCFLVCEAQPLHHNQRSSSLLINCSMGDISRLAICITTHSWNGDRTSMCSFL